MGRASIIFHLLLATAAFGHTDVARCPGCSSDVSNPNSQDIRDVISRTLGKTNAGFTLTNVKNCKSQVVAGVKYDCQIEIKSPSGQVSECQLSVVQRPWLKDDKEQIISESCSSVSRAKRDTWPVPFPYPKPEVVDCNTQKDGIIAVLKKQDPSLTYVNGTHCVSWVLMTPEGFLGVNYNNTIQVTSSQLPGIHTCILTYTEMPWGHPGTQIEHDTCSQLVRKKREVCDGCPMEQDPNSPEMKKKMSQALSQTNSALGLVGVDKCTSQVVAGILYDCTIRVSPPHSNGVETCHMKILEQPWISKEPQVVGNTCSTG